MTEWDIYSVRPGLGGTLRHKVILGGYDKWNDAVEVVNVLVKAFEEWRSVFADNRDVVSPVFTIQVCKHQKNSTQWKIIDSHNATKDKEIIQRSMFE